MRLVGAFILVAGLAGPAVAYDDCAHTNGERSTAKQRYECCLTTTAKALGRLNLNETQFEAAVARCDQQFKIWEQTQ